MVLQALLLDSFRFFRNHLFSILLIIVPVVFPIELFRDYYAESLVGQEANLTSEFPVLLLGLLVYPIYAGGIIFFIASVVSGNRLNVRSCWLLGLKYWGPFLLLSLLLGLVTGIGFVLFLVPGVIVLVRFSFAEFDLLLKGQSPVDALRLSWDATRPYFWLILGRIPGDLCRLLRALFRAHLRPGGPEDRTGHLRSPPGYPVCGLERDVHNLPVSCL